MKLDRRILLLLALAILASLAACASSRGGGGGGGSSTAEICNDGIDNDGDGAVDEGDDNDGDGFWTCGTDDIDCDDNDPAIHPAAGESCDGGDSDCDGEIPADELDADGDGCMVCEGDPDDSNPDDCEGSGDDDDSTPPNYNAPTTPAELSLYLFREFDHADPGVLRAGVINLRTFLEDFETTTSLDMGSTVGDRAWTIAALTEADWGGAPHWAGHNPDDQLPMAVAVRSSFGTDDHAALVGLVDQTPLEPSNQHYDRSFVTSWDEWINRESLSLQTTNSITRENILMTLTFTSYKDYRWVQLPDEDGWAVVGRSWIIQQYENEGGGTTMDFNSNVELTVPSGSGTLRYNTLWSAMHFGVELADSVLMNLIRNGIQDGYEATEAYLEANAGP